MPTSEDIPCFVINLDSSKERFKAMKKQCDSIGITAHKISAIQGSTLSERAINEVYCSVLNKKNAHRDLTTGEIGCYLSHRKVWKKIIENNIEMAIIIEDDTLINKNLMDLKAFRSSFETYDLIKLFDTRETPHAQAVTLNDKYDLVNYHRIPNCAAGYIITRSGAEKFLSRKKFFRPVDIDMQHTYELGASIVGVKPYLITLDKQWDSDISLQSSNIHSNHSSFLRNVKYRIKLACYRIFFTSSKIP